MSAAIGDFAFERAPAPKSLALLRKDVACVFARGAAARTTWEVLTTYPGVHAFIMHRLAHGRWCGAWLYAARLVAFLARWWTNVDIHPGARNGRRLFIDHGAGVVIGGAAEIGDDDTLYHGVNLGHHLIADPVGKAMSRLLRRIQALEAQLAAAGVPAPQACDRGGGEGRCECAAGLGDVGTA